MPPETLLNPLWPKGNQADEVGVPRRSLLAESSLSESGISSVLNDRFWEERTFPMADLCLCETVHLDRRFTFAARDLTTGAFDMVPDAILRQNVMAFTAAAMTG